MTAEGTYQAKSPQNEEEQVVACCDDQQSEGSCRCCSDDECEVENAPTRGEASKQQQTKESVCCSDGECGIDNAFTRGESSKQEQTKESACCVASVSHGNRNEDGGCCDQSCLEKVALRECREWHDSHEVLSDSREQGKRSPPESDPPRRNCESPECCKNGSGSLKAPSKAVSKPCEYHLQSIHRRFAPSLSKLGCICWDLIASGLPSCCSTSASPSRTGSLRARNRPNQAHTSLTLKMGQSESRASNEKRLSNASSSCCSSRGNIRSCQNGTHRASEDNQCVRDDDIERGPAVLEQVLLTVQGMTCSGCEKNLRSALNAIRTIRNVKTSLVLARAEFEIDVNSISVDEAIASIKRKTNYVCSRILENKSTQALALSVPSVNQEQFCSLLSKEPIGITDIISLDVQTVHVQYNTHIIGARTVMDVLQKLWDEETLPERNSGSNNSLQLAPIPPHPAIAAGRKQVKKEGFYFFSSAVLTIPVLVFSWTSFPFKKKHELAFNATSLALATIIQVGVAFEIYPRAVKSLFFSRLIEMDLLIMISTTTAYIFSVVAFAYAATGKPLPTGQFFETSTLLVTLIMLGRFINELTRQKATESISIRSLQPAKALLLSRDRRTTAEIDARLLQYGDTFRVPPDSRIVTDGTVVHGGSEVDESMVTGEYTPVAKAIGSKVIAGSINGCGLIDVSLDKLPWENTISTIANMVDEAELSKPKAQRIADRIAGYFVPVIVCITIIVFLVWIIVGKFVKHQRASLAVINALTFAIATLIVSCPCAIGLAVPMVVVIANGVAAKHGVVLKAPETIENTKRITHAVFDKTGTLTENHMSVVREQYQILHTHNELQIKSILLSLLDGVNHPISKAVVQHLRTDIGSPSQFVENIKVVTGKGVEGTYNGRRIRAGNTRWLGLALRDPVLDASGEGCSIFCFMIGDSLAATYALANSLRPEATCVVSGLIQRGVKVSILSGDDASAVHSVAMELGIPVGNTRSRCSPAEKAQYLRELITENPKAVTLFCGDGTNDAVALKQATIGVHMCDGTDIAQEAADVVLVRPDLSCIIDLLDISKAAYRRIIFNFAWSAVYNVSAILLAAGALAELNVRIPPEFAGLGEVVSVLPVILIAIQLKFVGFGRR